MSISDEAIADELMRMNDLWGPWGYGITYTPNQLHPWHAKFTEPGAVNPSEWHADTSQQMHLVLFDHYQGGLRLPEESLELPALFPDAS